MNQQIKEEWCQLLESGEFTQGKKKLKRADGSMCCLGVLCELYRRKTGNGEWTLARSLGSAYAFEEFVVNGNHNRDYLPRTVCDWAGLDDANPSVDGEPLAIVNDDMESSFASIAKLIRKHL